MIATDDHGQHVQEYINGVQRGTIVASRLVKLAVRRHLADLEKARVGKRWSYRFVPQYANNAIDFLQLCPQSKGEWAGQPLKLEPWQKFIVWSLFGWRRKKDKTRRFRKAFISVARKNGKSTFCAAIGLLLAMFDEPMEGGAEVYVVATKEDQARIVHEEAKRMVRRSLALSKRGEIFTKAITFAANDGVFKPLGSDSDQSGYNPHGVIKDELHAWRERHRNLHDEMSTGGAARKQPLELIITTAGDDRSLIWKEELEYATRVLESVDTRVNVSDTLFAFVASLDPEDDPYNEKNWPKANPNLGVSVKVDYLRDKAREAKFKPSAHNAFMRYHANVETTSHERAIIPEVWMACPSDMADFRNADAVFGAIDLGRSDDFAAIGLVAQFEEEIHLRGESYTCQERCKELLTADVAAWIREGFLIEHKGNQVDFTAIEDRVVELSRDLGCVTNWAVDPTFAGQLGQRLLNVHGIPIYEFIQTPRCYNEPIRKFTRAVKAGQVHHVGDPCMGWQARNLTIKRNNRDEWMPDKGVGWQKIDLMVALLMGYAGVIFYDRDVANGTFYEDHELEVS